MHYRRWVGGGMAVMERCKAATAGAAPGWVSELWCVLRGDRIGCGLGLALRANDETGKTDKRASFHTLASSEPKNATFPCHSRRRCSPST